MRAHTREIKSYTSDVGVIYDPMRLVPAYLYPALRGFL